MAVSTRSVLVNDNQPIDHFSNKVPENQRSMDNLTEKTISDRHTLGYKEMVKHSGPKLSLYICLRESCSQLEADEACCSLKLLTQGIKIKGTSPSIYIWARLVSWLHSGRGLFMSSLLHYDAVDDSPMALLL
ncbi:hypothetical protein O6P43_002931 [Quillaja saponaria]|uniref:Uncharacterized protein n=1 Tax=Quillaja saponaria TaxID=32244 RepID=A0AAD7QDI6_QUISA|nr:hypothetical protein O6P43_002931 [Quillaja saponaria]